MDKSENDHYKKKYILSLDKIFPNQLLYLIIHQLSDFKNFSY